MEETRFWQIWSLLTGSKAQRQFWRYFLNSFTVIFRSMLRYIYSKKRNNKEMHNEPWKMYKYYIVHNIIFIFYDCVDNNIMWYYCIVCNIIYFLYGGVWFFKTDLRRSWDRVKLHKNRREILRGKWRLVMIKAFFKNRRVYTIILGMKNELVMIETLSKSCGNI